MRARQTSLSFLFLYIIVNTCALALCLGYSREMSGGITLKNVCTVQSSSSVTALDYLAHSSSLAGDLFIATSSGAVHHAALSISKDRISVDRLLEIAFLSHPVHAITALSQGTIQIVAYGGLGSTLELSGRGTSRDEKVRFPHFPDTSMLPMFKPLIRITTKKPLTSLSMASFRVYDEGWQISLYSAGFDSRITVHTIGSRSPHYLLIPARNSDYFSYKALRYSLKTPVSRDIGDLSLEVR